MPDETLKHAPLVEVIFEARWGPSPGEAEAPPDPNYKLLPGRLSSAVASTYPAYESLPAAALPDEIVAGVVQHRWRSKLGEWPLLQVGPGVLSINETKTYEWSSFRARCVQGARWLRECYAVPGGPEPKRLVLRYIDAVDFDHTREDVLTFLREKMSVGVSLPSQLFSSGSVVPTPSGLNLSWNFPSSTPTGNVLLAFRLGTREGRPALVWETTVHSPGSDSSFSDEAVGEFLDAAHAITRDWFRRLTAGELERRFRDG